jgi:photosystem II stability/assembly factor-like uncharacterized protein
MGVVKSGVEAGTRDQSQWDVRSRGGRSMLAQPRRRGSVGSAALGLVVVCLLGIAGPASATVLSKTYDFSQAELTFSQDTVADTVFDIIGIAGYGADIENVGRPCLPLRPVSFSIPYNQRLDSVTTVVGDADTLPGPYWPMPVQAARCTLCCPGEFTQPYAYDRSFPADFCDGAVDGSMSTYRLASLNLRPVRWLPDGRLVVARTLTVHIYTSGSTFCGLAQSRRSSYVDGQLRAAVYGLVENPGELDNGYPVAIQDPEGELQISDLPSTEGNCVDCVIVADDDGLSEWLPYADVLTEQGIITTVRTIGWISTYYPGRDRAEAIRNFIKAAYQSWGTDFVILAGWQQDDDGLVGLPTRYIYHQDAAPYGDNGRLRYMATTDQYFADLEGTWDDNGNGLFAEAGENSYTAAYFHDGEHGCMMGQQANPNQVAHAYWTDDGGTSWTAAGMEQGEGLSPVDMVFVDENTGWCVGTYNSAGVMLATTDGGHDWEIRSGIPSVSSITKVTCAVVGQQTYVWCLCDGHDLLTSTDAGSSWSLTTPQCPSGMESQGFSDMWFGQTGDGLLCGSGKLEGVYTAFVLRTTDFGTTWSYAQLYQGSDAATTSAIDVRGGEGWVAGNEGGTPIVSHTTDLGQSWEHTPQTCGTLYDIVATAGTVWALDGGHILELVGTTLVPRHTAYDKRRLFYTHDGAAWCVGITSTFMHSTDGGQTWHDELPLGRDWSAVDCWPDVWLGRLPAVPCTGDAAIIQHKLWCYRNQPSTATVKRCLFSSSAGVSAPWDPKLIMYFENWESTLMGLGLELHELYHPPSGTQGTDHWEGDEEFTRATLIPNLNLGPHFVCDYWHSGPNAWEMGDRSEILNYTDLDTGAVRNGDAVSLVFGNGCHALYLQGDEKIGRSFLTSAAGGGVAYVGRSVKVFFPESPVCPSFLYEVFGEGDITLGTALANAVSRPYGAGRERALVNFLCDPTLDVWTDAPTALTVEHDVAILPQPTDFKVKVHDEDGVAVDGATVCLSLKYADDDYPVYEVGLTREDGSAVLHIEPKYTGELVVSVTKHNYLPYRGTCAVGLLSDDPDATGNNEQRHIARVPGKGTLHIVYTANGNVMHSRSDDGGLTWHCPDVLGQGEYPSLTLNYPDMGSTIRTEPWVVYRSGCDIKLARIVSGQGVSTTTLLSGNAPDSVPGAPSVAACPLPDVTLPLAWATFEVTYTVGTKSSYKIQARRFDSRSVSRTDILDSQEQHECSRPCVAITPGDVVHVAWQLDNESRASVWYSDFRGTAWSTPFWVSHEHDGAHNPFVEAAGSMVRVAWASPADVPDIWAREKPIGGMWETPYNASQTTDASDNPVLALKAVEAWQEDVDSQGDVYVRMFGDVTNLSRTPVTDSRYPSIVAETDGGTGRTTAYVVWTEGLSTPTPQYNYEVSFATRNWTPQESEVGDAVSLYSVATGESLPSEYCESRDSAVECDGYALDYGADSLTYRLPYLDPQYDYEARFVVYHDSGGTWRQAVSVEDTLETQVSYRREVPETVVVSISPASYQEDAEVCLQNEKLRGQGCVVTDFDVVQVEPADRDSESGGGGGGQSAATVPLYARLDEPTPTPFASEVHVSLFLTRQAKVCLRVYDASGRVVRSLLDGECPAGTTSLVWDGRDAAGAPVPAGTYFARLTTGRCTSVRKVVLTR